jgi:hypothetical protein
VPGEVSYSPYSGITVEMGRAAYEAYLQVMYVSALPAGVMTWETMPERVRMAWIEAAVAVRTKLLGEE